MSTPQTTIYICTGVHLDPRYEHTIYFENREAQQSYFEGRVMRTLSSYSYARKTWPLQVQVSIEEANLYNYLFFRNGSTGKTYYYFVTHVEYKNEGMVELTLEMDVLQTYLFDFKLLDCFVERQHTETDGIGEYTLDEGLDVGVLRESHPENWSGLNEMCILVLSTFNPNHAETTKPVDALGYYYDGVFSGLTVWAVDSAKWAAWSRQLNSLSEAGFIDGIVAMWMYPKSCVVLGGEQTWEDDDICKVVQGCRYSNETFTYSRATDSLAEYTPKNKRLLSYPYRSLYVTNNQGGSAVYRFERFGNPSMPSFRVKGSISPDATIKMYPADYNGVSDILSEGTTDHYDAYGNYDLGLTLGNYPSCAWDADVYKLWLAQNQNQQRHSIATSGLAIGGGAVTAIASLAMGNVAGAVGGAGAVIGGAQQIGALMAQKEDMSIQPPQSRGGFSSNVNITANMHTFTFYTKEVDYEHARTIDDYFTMYGYKLNRVMKPNLCARPAFTYIKTVGCNIAGVRTMPDPDLGQTGTINRGTEMATEDRLKICSIFDKGITFWKDGDKIADYSQDNTP